MKSAAITNGDIVFCKDPRFPNLVTRVLENHERHALIRTMNDGNAYVAKKDLTRLAFDETVALHVHFSISLLNPEKEPA